MFSNKDVLVWTQCESLREKRHISHISRFMSCLNSNVFNKAETDSCIQLLVFLNRTVGFRPNVSPTHSHTYNTREKLFPWKEMQS